MVQCDNQREVWLNVCPPESVTTEFVYQAGVVECPSTRDRCG